MDDINSKYSKPINQTSKIPSTFHFYSYFLDNIINKNHQYDEYSKFPELEKEYQEISNNKNLLRRKSIINLTSEDLKNKYTTICKYYNSGLNHSFIVSILLIFCLFLELKYLEPSESNIAILIISCISASFCFMLIVNINGQALIDTYGYIPFYLFSMIESVVFLCLFIFKFINFILIYIRLDENSCSKKIKCPANFIYLIIKIVNGIIFIGELFCLKFIFNLFLDGFKILILKHKTFFQKQIEINEKQNKGRKLEFTDDKNESINSAQKELKSE
jgi:membrane-associated HD superfamily phosphohydrolase